MDVEKPVFRDREKEMTALGEMYSKRGGQLLLMFGRRRVGKSRLLREFAGDKRVLFYQASTEGEAAQVEKFSSLLAELLGDSPPEHFTGWGPALERLIRRITQEKGKRLVILDEFQNIVNQNPAVPSIIQALWDEVGESSPIMMVLCGSIISELDRLRKGSQPLYGRFTGVMRIRPFSFKEASLFLHGKDLGQKVSFYGVLGGMPTYLNLAGSYDNIWHLIEREILDPMKILYEEVPLLLSQELREPAKFMNILSLVARGITRPAQIGAEMQMSSTVLSHYLAQLVEMELLDRQVPVTEKSPEKSRKGAYEIKDNFLRFWFRFLFPYKNLVEVGETKRVLDIIKRDFDTFIGPVAEEVVRRAVGEANINGALPARFENIGRYWNKRDEIDICGLPEKKGPYLWGECRWRNKKMGPDVYDALKKKVEDARFNVDGENLYFLFSKSGFSAKLREIAKSDEIILWDLADLEKALSDD